VDLSGTVAIVTGSGRGLGLAYAREFTRNGAAAVVNDVDEAVPQAAVTSLTDAGGTAAEVVPVGTSAAAQALVDRAVGEFVALWSHPDEVVVEFADGTGWSADALAGVWPDTFAPSLQTVGQQLPKEPS
jgi:NAD(P)-dependent dehydrogenase (short-subunit alcohol dehydrogenase family)